MRGTGQTVCLRVIQRLSARCLRFPRSIGGFSGGNFPPFWPIDLRFPTNRSIGIVVGNLNLVREKELGFPSQKRVGFLSLSLFSATAGLNLGAKKVGFLSLSLFPAPS